MFLNPFIHDALKKEYMDDARRWAKQERLALVAMSAQAQPARILAGLRQRFTIQSQAARDTLTDKVQITS